MKKNIIGMVIFVFFLIEILPAQNVLWVSGNTSRDQGFIDLLESQGYTVDRMANPQSIDVSKQALANTYDLVIVGRDLVSGDYDDSETEISLWNGITVPMINMTGYLLRSNRWRWVKSDYIKDTAYPVQAVMVNDPIFSGITPDKEQQIDFCTSVVTVPKVIDVGNGTLVGRRAANGAEYAWIIRWEQGVEYYPGSGQIAAGPRLAFIGGQAGGSPGDGAFNLTAAGTIMFLNAVYEMSGATFNRPPAVVAGNDCISNRDQPLQLNGTVYDPEGIADITWSVQSGPGTVSFTSTEVADPYVIFSTKGTYILKLTASDTQHSASDFMTVSVRDPRENTMFAHWDFENIPQSGELADVTGNGFNGIFYGTQTPAMVEGNLTSGSLAVDLTAGEMYWEVPNAYDDGGLNFNGLSTGMTVTAWVRISDSSNHAPVIIGNGLDGWRFGLDFGYFDFVCLDIGFDVAGYAAYDGNWHHIAGVFDGVNAKGLLYVDGQLVGSKDLVPGTYLSKGDDYPYIQIGNRGGADRQWEGYIDDIAIYNYPLSLGQIEQLASAGDRQLSITAGADQIVQYDGTDILMDAALLCEDGRPNPASLVWSVVSTPAGVSSDDVIFSDVSLEDPSVILPGTEGTYILRLTANDSVNQAYDDVSITVTLPDCSDLNSDGLRLVGDLSGPGGYPDCHIDIYDFAALAANWMGCNDPADVACQQAYDQQYFVSWPAGASPREIGKRVAEHFYQTPHFNFGSSIPPGHITYPEVCTWYGALTFANITGDTGLSQHLIEKRFEPLFEEDAGLIPGTGHVDLTVFGSVPLEIYIQNRDSRFLALGQAMADAQWANPTPDGLSSETRFWIDDMYMITAIQTQAYRATGDLVYIDRAALEMAAYLDRLQQPSGLFYHAETSPFYWGRGNGWVAAGLTELLRSLPERHPLRSRIMQGYQEMMSALLQYQSEEGMWLQVLDYPAAWPETSCTGMFTFAMITGVKNGWLDAEVYGSAARKGWLALIQYIDENADVHEVCQGTNKGTTLEYYLDRQRIIGDLHGQVPVLWCASALLR